MTVQVIIAGLVALTLSAGCLLVLWVFVRFTVISEWRSAAGRAASRSPAWRNWRLSGTFDCPPLEAYYRSGVVEHGECYLVPPGVEDQRWYVVHFIPLTKRDVAEWMKITAVPGIPLALDDSKGVYYLPFAVLRRGEAPPVLLREPGLAHQDREVAPSVEDFVRFQSVEE